LVTSTKLELHRARLVLGLVTTFGGYTIPCIFQATEAPAQPGHSSVGECSGYWRWFRPPLNGKKQRVLCSSVPCDQDCRHTGTNRFLKGLAVNLSQPSDRHWLNDTLTVSNNPDRLKADKLRRNELCIPVSTVSNLAALRSAADDDLVAPRTRLQLGNRAFLCGWSGRLKQSTTSFLILNF